MGCLLARQIRWSVVGICIWLSPLAPRMHAQQRVNTSSSAIAELPSAPQPAAIASEAGQTSQTGTATLSGTVLDSNNDVVQDAHVVLSTRGAASDRAVESGPNGEFSFNGLPAGTYKVTVTGRGMGTFISPPITVHPGEMRIVPQVVLAVAATTTSITVSGDRVELAEEQVKIAEEQRVLGVLPNFYSSYDWNAPPMMAKQKFKLAIRSVIDPVAFAEVAGLAGLEQYNNTFPGFGRGPEGYAKRYGAAYATDVSGRVLTSAVFASMFHEDPRYFYKGTGTGKQRTLYAISAAVMTRKDDGSWRPNYARVLGNLGSGALANLYYPSTSRGIGLTFTNALVDTAASAGTNLIREFVLKGITAHAGGKP